MIVYLTMLSVMIYFCLFNLTGQRPEDKKNSLSLSLLFLGKGIVEFHGRAFWTDIIIQRPLPFYGRAVLDFHISFTFGRCPFASQSMIRPKFHDGAANDNEILYIF